MKTAICLVSAILLSGCGTDDRDVCALAVAHVKDCGGTAVAPSTSCDRDAAGQLLAIDCAQLASATGTRQISSLTSTLGGIACAAGIVRFCTAPACTAPLYPSPSTTCRDYIDLAGCGGCQFYACREAEHACGASGYYLGYAEKYCVRFLQALRPRMSPAGQRFLDVARDCLMRYVDAQLPAGDVCDDVKARAFQSHVACYHDNGFCQLSSEDRWLLINTVDPADFNVSAALQTALSCL
ncbi:MAG: hypothetical protein JWN44_4188 [Myxococcales bacterium]|nr:hypothetical protein [Myxococcales bacterium]